MTGMKVPLIVESFVDQRTNKQQLEIWYNSKRRIIDPPFLPYLVSKVVLPLQSPGCRMEPIKGFPLSTLCETDMYKYSFPNTGFISNINRLIERPENKELKPKICDNHTEFRERIIIDKPDYFYQFANTDELKVFGFDIETLRYQNRNYPGICSMAWGTSTDDVKSIQIPIYWNDKGEPYVDKEDEKRMFIEFRDDFIAIDPDIVIGYNHKDFDFPEYFNRCKIHGIDYSGIAREKSEIKVVPGKLKYMDVLNTKIGGRVVYDIMYSVYDDQSLHGIKRKGLKDVAAWMELPVIREDTDNTATIPMDKMKIYNESDVVTTFRLFKVYFLNNQTLAEMFGIPLNMMIDGSPSFLANVFQAPDLHAMGIASDGMNRERHPEIYDMELREKNKGDDFKESAKDKKKKAAYEAAYVDILQTGLFKKVYKVDFKGMYNAIEITANISPETTKIVKYLPYNKNGFKCDPRGDIILYHIPDRRIGKTVVIAVNNTFDGVLRKKLKKIRETRFQIKQQMKTCTPEEIPRLESQQYGLKVVANIPSGYNGQATSRWGDIAVSILTVGIGRVLIQDTIKFIEAKYGGNDWILDIDDLRKVDAKKFKVCIEIDTDGIYVSKHIDGKDLNNYMSERVKQLLGVQENEMQLDFEEYKEGYFIEDQESNKRKGSDDIGDRTGKMKTYILYDMKDNLVIHGGALKGSKQPKCFDIALEKLIRCILKGEGSRKDVINDVLDIAKYDVKDLVFGVKLNQSPDDYDKTSMYAKLIAKARALGMEVKAGSELDYVKTWDGSEFVHTVQSLREIDKRHYEDMISKLIINLGLKEELMSKDTDAVDEWL